MAREGGSRPSTGGPLLAVSADSRSARIAITALLAMLAWGCSSTADSDRSADRPSVTPHTSAVAATCQELDAKIPADLTERKLRTAKDMGRPASTGVIWSNKAGTRVANLSSAPTDEQFGDGSSAASTKRTVQGTTATEQITDGIHKVFWHQAQVTGPCVYWTVVTQGLTPRELDTVLNTIKDH